jgi:competence protein ComEC
VVKLLWQEGKKKGKESVQAALSVTLFTLPVQLWFYYEIPIYSVPVNLLILPWMSLLMLTGMFAMLIPRTGIVGTAAYYILQWYEQICECFKKFPHHTWNPGRPEVWQVLAYYMILLILVGVGMWKKRHQRRAKRTESIALIAVLTVAVYMLTADVYADTRVTFLDVGQGDGIVVELESGEIYIFDCGSTSRERVGQSVLLPYLKYRGIRKIDAIFLSHGDKDHSSGIYELLELSEEEGITIEQLVLSPKESDFTDPDIPVTSLKAGDSFETQSASFLCLHPPEGYVSEDGNAESQCFYIDMGKVTILLTGDIQGEGERMLLEELKQHNISDITLLKVAHHGSRNSTSAELLKQIEPQVAVISCGKNNRYGHPHEEVLLRLEDLGSRVLTTPQYGAITVEIGKAVEVYGFTR